MRLAKLPRLRSLRLQLLASYVLALLLAAVMAATFFYVYFALGSDASTRNGLIFQAKWIEKVLLFNEDGKPVGLTSDRTAPWVYASASDDLKFRVLDTIGTILLASEPNAQVLAPPGQGFDPGLPVFRMQSGDTPIDVLTVSFNKGSTAYYIQVARSERVNLLARRVIGGPVLKTALLMGIISLLIFGGVVYLTLQRTLRPLRDASDAASRIAPSNLSKRLETKNLPTELTPLVEAFNMALDRLERGYRVQKEFLAGAAHELKTPLSLIRAQIELDVETDRASLLRDVDMTARQVYQLLHLAEVSEAQNYIFEPTNLVEVAGEVTEYLSRLADLRQIALHMAFNVEDKTIIEADRSAIFVLLKNLVENAIRHSFLGGTVLVVIEARGMHVQDGGSGIAEENFPNLFTRFWRSADRRDDGAGLGLAICHQIAATHGWNLDAKNVMPGAKFMVSFDAPSPHQI